MASPGAPKAAELFKLAQQQVRWHYQWIVIHDFLPRLVGKDTVDNILRPETYTATEGTTTSILRPHLQFYKPRESPYMPIELSVAAYRYGHSVIRPSYAINDVIPLPSVAGAQRIPLFSASTGELDNLNGFRPLPEQWGLQWKYFLSDIKADPAGPHDAHLPQPSYKLDAVISNPLGALPTSTAGPELLVQGQPESIAQVLAIRNLLRGLRLGLPSGQDVAAAMGITEILTDEQLYGDLDLPPDARADLEGQAPLWYYILKESKLKAEATHLGAVGGRIVAEVLVGLLAGDRLSFLHVKPSWTPSSQARPRAPSRSATS